MGNSHRSILLLDAVMRLPTSDFVTGLCQCAPVYAMSLPGLLLVYMTIPLACKYGEYPYLRRCAVGSR